jgi:hypothetical protein
MAAMDWNDKLAVMANLSFHFQHPIPHVRVHRKRLQLARSEIDEASVVAESSVPEEASEHRQSVIRQGLIYERLLLIQRLDGTAGRKPVFAIERGVDDFGKQMRHGRQAQSFCV